MATQKRDADLFDALRDSPLRKKGRPGPHGLGRPSQDPRQAGLKAIPPARPGPLH
jgi:hypothetical protein